LSFEAASVKPYKGPFRFSITGDPGTTDPGQISYLDVTLTDIILRAYDLRPYQIKGGPSWLDEERFDVVAKVPNGASKRDCSAMLQSLLADRFKLVVHRETQEGRTYSLVVDKRGPKLNAPTDGMAPEKATIAIDADGSTRLAANMQGRPVTVAGKGIFPMISNGMVALIANSQPISELAAVLARFMDGPVRDSTGLTGNYDFSLSFAVPDGMRMPGHTGECTTCTPAAEPPTSVFLALKEGLGLRLDASRGPIDVLIIDHAEKVPTEN
jgi:uncharacterized protein (TIGR03435 family)